MDAAAVDARLEEIMPGFRAARLSRLAPDALQALRTAVFLDAGVAIPEGLDAAPPALFWVKGLELWLHGVLRPLQLGLRTEDAVAALDGVAWRWSALAPQAAGWPDDAPAQSWRGLLPALRPKLSDRRPTVLSLRAVAAALLCTGPLAAALGIPRWPPRAAPRPWAASPGCSSSSPTSGTASPTGSRRRRRRGGRARRATTAGASIAALFGQPGAGPPRRPDGSPRRRRIWQNGGTPEDAMRRISTALLLLTACVDGGLTKHNSDPTATITSHQDGDAVAAGAPVALRGVVGDLNQSLDSLSVSWIVDGADACPEAAPDGDGVVTCTATLDLGGGRVVLEVRDGSGAAASDAVELAVSETGGGLQIDTLLLTPDPARTNDVLTAAATFDGVSADALDLTWTWSVDGVEVASGVEDQLDGSAPDSFDKGQTVSATLTADDGEATATGSTNPVVIANTPPTAPVARIDPASLAPGTPWSAASRPAATTRTRTT